MALPPQRPTHASACPALPPSISEGGAPLFPHTEAAHASAPQRYAEGGTGVFARTGGGITGAPAQALAARLPALARAAAATSGQAPNAILARNEIPAEAAGINTGQAAKVIVGTNSMPIWKRVYDFILAVLVWVNTLGQRIYQNHTPAFLGQTKQEWENELTSDRKIAWAEVTIAFKGMWKGGESQNVDPSGDEMNHAREFVALVHKMSNLSRLKRKYNAAENEDPNRVASPLWDQALRWYTQKYHGWDAIDPKGPTFLLRLQPLRA